MANPQQGEVELTVNDKPYTLKLSMNAAATLEARLKKRVGDILNDAGALSFTSLRDLVWLLLQKHHKAEFEKLETVGDFIDAAGGVQVFFRKLEELSRVNAPEGGDEAGGDGARPFLVVPPGGIGASSR